jgi:hypothetical protein
MQVLIRHLRQPWKLLLVIVASFSGAVFFLSYPPSLNQFDLAHGAGVGFLVLGGSLLLIGCLFVFPNALMPANQQASQQTSQQTSQLDELIKAQNDIRGTLLTAITGALALVAAYSTWQQLQITREGQVTERFAKAVELLGGDNDVAGRTGAIYALGRLAKDSAADEPTIQQILTTYVRHRAPWPPEPAVAAQGSSSAPTTTSSIARTSPTASSSVVAAQLKPSRPVTTKPPQLRDDGRPCRHPGIASLQKCNPDVQAALSTLGQEIVAGPNRQPLRAILVDTDLRGGLFAQLQLPRADFRGAQLDDMECRIPNESNRITNLRDADFRGASLVRAHLERADLTKANFASTEQSITNLEGVYLKGAILDKANFQRANLKGAHLGGVDLSRANLEGANLEEVTYNGATKWPGGHIPDGAIFVTG